MHALPTNSLIPFRPADFTTLQEGLDYAAGGATGLTFYDRRARPVGTLTYRDLRNNAVRLTQALLLRGLRRGDRVGLIATTDPGFIEAFFACQYAGLIPATLPLPLAFGSHRHYVAMLRKMLGTIDARAILASGAMAEFARKVAIGTDMVVVGSPSASPTSVDSMELPSIDPDDVSYLQFSSGSTRAPVAVAITHRALISNAASIIRDGLRITERDRAVSWLPLYHDMGLVGFVLTPVLCQVSVDLIATTDFSRHPLLWPRILSDNRGTLSYSPSFGYELCAKRAAAATSESFDLSRWRIAGIGGDMIRSRVLDTFAQTFAPHRFDAHAFVASYGMAETTLAVSFAPLDTGIQTEAVDMNRLEHDSLAAKPRPGSERIRSFTACGMPLPGYDVEIRDETGRPCRGREIGRLFVRGPSVMRMYWGQAKETATVLDADGWLDTGDLGFSSDRGLVITGRAKDVIVINGRNLLPHDLEWSAEQRGGLRSGDVAAFSVDQDDSEVIILLVQCRQLAPDQREIVRESVRAAVRAQHGVAVEIVLVPPRSLPKTSSGKLSRSKARAQYLAGELTEEPQPAAELQCAVP